MADVDIAIIGGGVIGLSCAHELARRNYAVALLEKHARFGEETSTHNSMVLHAGIYYPTGSLKARLCVAGRRQMAARCREWKIAHRPCGKLIAAPAEADIPILEKLLRQGLKNGVAGLELIDRPAALRREPNIAAAAALFSPDTAVFDVPDYLNTLAGRAQAAGALLVENAEVLDVGPGAAEVEISTRHKGTLTARFLVNAAGLYADDIARLCGDDRHRIYPCRGEYATVVPSRWSLINGLVYPPPDRLGLGVHLTRTIDGDLWLGPNARYIERKDDYYYGRRPPGEFLEAARRLCPALSLEHLRWGGSGIRPKRYGPHEEAKDFFIERQPDRPNIVHLIGIESPGLTASPAVAELVADLISEADR